MAEPWTEEWLAQIACEERGGYQDHLPQDLAIARRILAALPQHPIIRLARLIADNLDLAPRIMHPTRQGETVIELTDTVARIISSQLRGEGDGPTLQAIFDAMRAEARGGQP